MSAAVHSVNMLPEELILEVLLWLPKKYLLRTRCVSKVVRNLIDCPIFKKRYYEFHNSVTDFAVMLIEAGKLFSMDFQLPDNLKFSTEKEVIITHFEDPTYIGCCKGVVCLMILPALSYILLNPFNATFQMVNCSPRLHPVSSNFSIGFGYDYASDDYKIVRLEPGIQGNIQRLAVYSMNKDSLEQVIRNFSPGCSSHVIGICVEGALHWLWKNMNVYSCIAAFDLETETLRSVPLPPQMETGVLNLQDLGGRLCVCVKSPVSRTIVWVMAEYGVENSWTPLFNIVNEIESVIGCFPLWDNAQLLCFRSDPRLWMWLNTRNGSKENIHIHKLPREEQYHAPGYGTRSWICVRSPRRLGWSYAKND